MCVRVCTPVLARAAEAYVGKGQYGQRWWMGARGVCSAALSQRLGQARTPRPVAGSPRFQAVYRSHLEVRVKEEPPPEPKREYGRSKLHRTLEHFEARAAAASAPPAGAAEENARS